MKPANDKKTRRMSIIMLASAVVCSTSKSRSCAIMLTLLHPRKCPKFMRNSHSCSKLIISHDLKQNELTRINRYNQATDISSHIRINGNIFNSDPASNEQRCIIPLSRARLWTELFMTFITAGNILSQFKLKRNKKSHSHATPASRL